MPQVASSFSNPALTRRRVRTRQEKTALFVGMAAFFSAIAVVGWFGLSGLSLNEDAGQATVPVVIFAGGAPEQVAAEVEPVTETQWPTDEDEYFIGSFGDPVDDLYADEDDDGGWGNAALQGSASGNAG